MKNIYLFLLLIFISCDNDNLQSFSFELREEVMVENAVFRISYNEFKEQPNWIEYTVRDFVKVADRGNMDFYTVRNVWTSDDNDYYKNEWDKGHMAPAGSFTDSWSNLAKTFSFVNCALQKDSLNRGEWRELEEQVRYWAKDTGPIDVRIELKFSSNSTIVDIVIQEAGTNYSAIPTVTVENNGDIQATVNANMTQLGAGLLYWLKNGSSIKLHV